MDFLTFLSAYSIWTVLLIAIASILLVLKIIEGSKALWKKRTTFQNEAKLEGKRLQHEKELREAEEQAEEKRITDLEESLREVKTTLENQQGLIELLIRSDELNIKAWIQQQHEKWITLQCIDSQSLDLVLQRYEIYAEEGGNGWAKRMVQDIKQLPIVTVIPVQRDN